jgi:hypothetical protein
MHFIFLDNSQPLMLEANEGECNKEEMLSCTENTDDIVQLASSAEHDKKPDPIISARYFLYLSWLSTSFVDYFESIEFPNANCGFVFFLLAPQEGNSFLSLCCWVFYHCVVGFLFVFFLSIDRVLLCSLSCSSLENLLSQRPKC